MNVNRSNTYLLKGNESHAREALRAFWAGSSLGRPGLAVTCPNPDHEPELPSWGKGPDADCKSDTSAFASPPDTPQRPRKSWDLDPEWHRWITRETIFGSRWLAESMPHSLARFGTSLWLVATQLGADYYWNADSTWVDPIDGILDKDIPSFSPDHPVIRSLAECIRASAEVAGDHGFIAPPALLDALTTLGALRGEEALMMELIDRPESVKRWTARVTDLLLDTHRYFQELCESLGYGENTSWYPIMSEGPMEAVQCDAALMLSPEMFREFVVPDLAKQVEYFDCSLYHLDGNAQQRHFDCLAALPKLNGIQWNPEPGDCDPRDHLDLFREIRHRGWSLYLQDNVVTVETAEWLTRQLGPDGLFLGLPPFASPDEAEAGIERIARAVS